MNSETIKIIRGEILSESGREYLIDSIVTKKETGELPMPGVSPEDEPEQKIRKISTAAIYALYQNEFDHLETIKLQYSISKEDMILLAEIAVDLAHVKNEPANAFNIIEYQELDSIRINKTFMSYMNSLLQDEEFEAACEVWNNYKELCTNEQRVNDMFKNTFKHIMAFKPDESERDYSKGLQFQELFKLPKEFTYPVVIEEFEHNKKKGNYLTAAILSQKFGLTQAVTNQAAFLAWKDEMEQFQNNLDRGNYREIEQLEKADPYAETKNISKQYHLFDYKNENNNLDKDLIRKIHEIVLPISEKLVDSKLLQSNKPNVKIFLANDLINDYQLFNSKVAVGTAEKTAVNIVKLIDFIQDESKDIQTAKDYKPILDNLLSKIPIDDKVIEKLSKKLFYLALDNGDLEYAKKIFDTYSLEIRVVGPKLAEYANSMADSDQFTLLMDFIEMFDLQKMLKDNDVFMRKIDNYYYATMKKKKYLNCFAIADMFQMNEKKRFQPITLLIDEHFKTRNLKEIHKLMKKYKMKKRNVKSSARAMYLRSLKTDREYAIRLRREFGLSIFDVGIITWFLYEFLKFKMK